MVTENFITSTQYMYKIFECLLSKYDVSKFTLFLSKFKTIYESKNKYDNTIIKDITFDFENYKFYNEVVIKLEELIKKADKESRENEESFLKELAKDDEAKIKPEKKTKTKGKKETGTKGKKEQTETKGNEQKEPTTTNGKEADIKELIDELIGVIEFEIFKKTTYYKEIDPDPNPNFIKSKSFDELLEELIKNKDNKLISLVDNTPELLKSLIETSNQLEKLIDDTKLKELKELEELIEKKKTIRRIN